MSEVTAVPLPALAKGSLVKMWFALALLLALAAGLAWWGTAAWQIRTLQSGARLQVVAEGHGPTLTDADVMLLAYRLHVNRLDAPVLQDSETVGQGQPFPATTAQVYPGFADALRHMRAGGRYVLYLPPGTHVSGPIPPSAGFTHSDTLVFEIRTLQLAAGMAQELQRQQMQQLQQELQAQMQAQQGGGAAGGEGHGGGVPQGNQIH